MKYKEIYAALNQRRQEVPGFSYSDYSGWRAAQAIIYDPPAATLDRGRGPIRPSKTMDHTRWFFIEHHCR